MNRHPLDDLPDDIRDHLERETADNVARGMDADAARQAALRTFGSTALASEAARRVWIPVWFDQLGQDLRYAVRLMRRSRGASLAALFVLALGIGTTSAVFSLVHGVMLKPLPYRDPDRVVSVWETTRGGERPNVIAGWNFIAWQERSRSFDGLGMVGGSRKTFAFADGAEEVTGLFATASVFRILGVPAAMGRVYSTDEDSGPRSSVILLSYQLWTSRFGARADTVGSSVVAGGRPRTVVGILPPDFTIEGIRADFYVPYGETAAEIRAEPGRGFSHGVARLKDGVTLDQARADMSALASQLATEQPRLNQGRTVRLIPVQEQMIGTVRPALLVLSGAVLLVLLLACANVAGLLLARNTARTRELGLRIALGAGRLRLVRQLLTESVLFACAGGAAGVWLAMIVERALVALVARQANVPRLDQVSIDPPVLWFTLGVSIATGLLFGVAPALAMTHPRGDALRETTGSRTTMRSQGILSSFAIAQIALSLVLLGGAGLFAASFLRLQHINPGFRADGILTARVTLGGPQWNDDRVSAAFFTDAIERLRTLPGASGAAGISFLPLTGSAIGTSFWRADAAAPGPGAAPSTTVLPVTPGYFQVMGIPLRAGRDFDGRDALDASPVVIASESAVRRLFPNENPIGRRIHVSLTRLPNGGDAEIVGVVGDVAMSALDEAVGPAIYVPHTQLNIGIMTFVVRTPGDPLALASGLRAAVRDLDRTVAVAGVRTLDEVVDGTLAQPQATAALMTAFAIAALLLAAAGIYGVMAYSASRRTQEIGVRLALGARPGEIVSMVVRQAMMLALAGVAIGLAAALGLSRLLTHLLYDTAPADPTVFGGVTLVLLLTAVIAAWIPARRASRVDPILALRVE